MLPNVHHESHQKFHREILCKSSVGRSVGRPGRPRFFLHHQQQHSFYYPRSDCHTLFLNKRAWSWRILRRIIFQPTDSTSNKLPHPPSHICLKKTRLLYKSCVFATCELKDIRKDINQVQNVLPPPSSPTSFLCWG